MYIATAGGVVVIVHFGNGCECSFLEKLTFGLFFSTNYTTNAGIHTNRAPRATKATKDPQHYSTYLDATSLPSISLGGTCDY